MADASELEVENQDGAPPTGGEPGAEGQPPDISRQGVDLSDLEDDEGQGKPPVADDGRRGRRAERRALKDELASERQRAQDLERQLSEARRQPAYVPTPAAAPPPVQQGDPLASEIDSMQAQQDAITLALASGAKLNDQQVQHLQGTWHQLERRKSQVMIDARIREMGVAPQGAPPAQNVQRQILQGEFPEVFASASRQQTVLAKTTEIIEQRPGIDPFIAAREACKRVIAEKGWRQGEAPPATNGQKAKLSAVPSRGGAGGTGSHYTPTKQELSAARAYTQHLPDLSDEQRFRRWAKEVAVPAGLIKRG